MSNTIKDAVIQVLKKSHTGLTPKEIYSKIVEQNLYEFHTKEPVSVINHAIRKSCTGVNIKASIDVKLFKVTTDGKYKLKDL